MLKKQPSGLFTKGFSLIEIVVVLGLLAGAGVFLGQILNQSQKGQKKVSANLDFTTKMWEVFNVLQNSSYCNSTANLVFKEKTSSGALVPAKLSNENTPATNTVNWIGYQVGGQDIKVLEEGDVIENTLTVSQITFERQKTDATPSQIVPASANTPTSGKTTHYLNLVITANPTSGPGFPVTKTFKLNLITDTPASSPTHAIAGCHTEERGVKQVNIPSPTAYILGIKTVRSPITRTPAPTWTCTNGNCDYAPFPYERFRLSEQSTDEICQNQGYAYASGSCYIQSSTIGGPAIGALASNRTIDDPAPLWAIGCRYGSGASDPPTSITCVK